MKKHMFCFAIALLSGLWLPFAGSARNLENLSFSIAYLKESNEPKHKFGTGFLVQSDNLYLVTAAHVARFISRRGVITLRDPGDVPVSTSFADLFPRETALPWHFHSEADVAILILPLNDKTSRTFKCRSLPVNRMMSEEAAPQRERALVIMGFPLALGTKDRFSPITVESKAASGLLRMNRFDSSTEATFFVLDRPSIGGHSGAPVYLMPRSYPGTPGMNSITENPPESKPKCVGLVHGTQGDDTGGKLAMIIPSAFVVGLIKEVEKSEKKPVRERSGLNI